MLVEKVFILNYTSNANADSGMLLTLQEKNPTTFLCAFMHIPLLQRFQPQNSREISNLGVCIRGSNFLLQDAFC